MNPEDVRVVLMTRLNVYMYAGPPSRDRAALAQRLEVFRRWTVPSVWRQTRLPDEWIVLADAGTHPEDLRRLESLLRGLPARVVLLPSEFTPDEYRERMGAELSTPRPWLLTIRLDSDDAIGAHYVERLTAAAEAGPTSFLNAAHGYRLSGRHLAPDVELSNAFMGLLEPGGAERPLTGYCTSHMRASEVAPVLQVDMPPSWLVIIHGGNMSSRSRAGRVPLSSLREEFDLSPWRVLGAAALTRMTRVLSR